jgi:fatty-acyl-CoA synthase
MPERLPDPASLLLLIFTSGSTSAPKAVRRSSDRIAAAAGLGFTSADTLYISMPLFHGNALFGVLFPGLAGGARIALRDKFSATAWLDDVRRYQATFTSTVGRALSYVLATAPSGHDKDHNLKVVLAPESSPPDAAAFTERFGVPVVTGYGSSEAGIVLLPSRRVGALGRAPQGADIAVVDSETGAECAAADLDDNGRLCNAEQAVGELVRKDSVGAFEGYYGNEEADRDRLHSVDGHSAWFWSGDLAYRDADGVFYFAGRVGDWLRVDSENFAAAPIERIIGRHPDVTGVAVVGVADPHSGDQVLAVVETASFDPQRFDDWLREQPDLGTKWAPRFIRVTSRLPTVSLDKTDRKRIRRDGWDTTDPVWWKPVRDDTYRLLTDHDRDTLRKEFAANDRTALLPGGSA